MINDKPLEKSLQLYFNHQSFRPGQKEIIKDVLNGNDVLGILPTGSGKSLCYQLPAMLLPGITIVVSPLISLMIDQVKRLRSMNYKKVITLNSFVNYQTRKQILRHLSTYKLIYVSPELLQQTEIINHLQKIHISLFVIDEAHCISQWGHEFRPDYLRLRSIIHLLGNPPVLALSATATLDVQKDIIQSLNKPSIKKHIYPMDRKNIAFSIQKVSNDQEKLVMIVQMIKKHNIPILIYFSSRKETERVANDISEKVPNKRVAFYHGGLESLDRITIQQQFMNDQIDVICCTSAFGMGIDKENIRLIIHYHFPPQLESYIQEFGRAGRDGKASVSLVLYATYDQFLPERMIEQELPTEENLDFIFQKMYELVVRKKELPTNVPDIVNLFQVNEIQWRYVHYQLEKHGLIKENIIHYDNKNWQQSLKVIKEHRKHRLLLKQSKLNEMIKWLNEKKCLRNHLYKKFQHSYQQPIQYCCSNCDFLLENWIPEQQTVHHHSNQPWEDQLKTLLLGDRK